MDLLRGAIPVEAGPPSSPRVPRSAWAFRAWPDPRAPPAGRARAARAHHLGDRARGLGPCVSDGRDRRRHGRLRRAGAGRHGGAPDSPRQRQPGPARAAPLCTAGRELLALPRLARRGRIDGRVLRLARLHTGRRARRGRCVLGGARRDRRSGRCPPSARLGGSQRSGRARLDLPAGQLVATFAPPRDAVTIGVPLAGEWQVVSGGRSALVNNHWTLTVQRHAIDVEQLVDGRSFDGDRSRLENFHISVRRCLPSRTAGSPRPTTAVPTNPSADGHGRR